MKLVEIAKRVSNQGLVFYRPSREKVVEAIREAEELERKAKKWDLLKERLKKRPHLASKTFIKSVEICAGQEAMKEAGGK